MYVVAWKMYCFMFMSINASFSKLTQETTSGNGRVFSAAYMNRVAVCTVHVHSVNRFVPSGITCCTFKSIALSLQSVPFSLSLTILAVNTDYSLTALTDLSLRWRRGLLCLR